MPSEIIDFYAVPGGASEHPLYSMVQIWTHILILDVPQNIIYERIGLDHINKRTHVQILGERPLKDKALEKFIEKQLS